MDILFATMGWIATVLGIVMFAPQAYKAVKSRSVEGLSKPTYVAYIIGASLWVLYSTTVDAGTGKSFISNAMPGFISNFLLTIFLVPLIWMMFKNKLIPILLISVPVIATTAGLTVQFTDTTVPDIFKMLDILVAGSLTGLSFLPQLITTIKNKGAKEFSIMSGLIGFISNTMWTIFWAKSIIDFAGGNDVLLTANYLATIFAGLLATFSILVVILVKYYEKHNKKVTA